MYDNFATLTAAFLGSAVESVEALTVVLAVGLTRGWRQPLLGAAAALGVLAVPVVVFGQLITQRVPEPTLKMVIGTLVLLFGLRWLRKAILRSAGVVALHDEEEEFRSTVSALSRSRRDREAFVIPFQAVLLEGLEVAFIVFAVGSSGGSLGVAAAGGFAAMVLVAGLGVFLRKPLSRVPENTLKLSVGLLLASLGTFWVAEGMGVVWPLDLGSILILVAVYFAGIRAIVALISQRRRALVVVNA